MGDVARPLEFRVDPAVQAGIDILAERANEDLLSDEERTEYEALINPAGFISILKLKASRRLNASPAQSLRSRWVSG